MSLLSGIGGASQMGPFPGLTPARLHLLLLPLWGLVLRDWLRGEPAWRARTAACLCAGALAAAWAAGPGARLVPTEWYTTLQIGVGLADINQLHGAGTHAGENFFAVYRWFARSPIFTLRDIVSANLGLAAFNAFAYFLLGWRVLGGALPALGLAACFVFNVVTFHSALSEVPAQLLATYFFMAVPAGAVLAEKGRGSSMKGLAAFGSLVILGWLVAWTRVEMGLGWLIAAACGAARLLRPPAEAGEGDFLTGFLLRVRSWGLLEKSMLALLAAVLSVDCWQDFGQWRWLTEGLRPLNPTALLLPVVLAGVFPIGVVALFLAGLVHSCRRLGAFLGLPVALVIMFRLYYAASCACVCDIHRFLTHLEPAVFFLALFGWREIGPWIARLGPGPAARRVALAALALSCCLPPEGLRRWFPDESAAGLSSPFGHLSGHRQAEVRYLLRAVDVHPDAVFLTKSVMKPSSTGPWKDYQWTLFGPPLPFSRSVPRLGRETAADMIRRTGWFISRPVFFYRGLDCALEDSEGCELEARGLKLVDERRFVNPFLCEPSQYGCHTRVIPFGLYELEKTGGRLDAIRERVESPPPGAQAWEWFDMARAARQAGDRELAARALARAEGYSDSTRAEAVLSCLAFGGPRERAALIAALVELDATGFPAGVWRDLARRAREGGDEVLAAKALERGGGPRLQ